jgi:putative integral membrane protein (TIGR02587 family)
VAVGKVQLGGGGDGEEDKGHGQNVGVEQDRQGERGESGLGKAPEDAPNETIAIGRQLVLGLCGAILVASNVAPTEEIMLIGIETSPWKLFGLAVFSVGVGGSILYFSDFHGADRAINPESGFDILTGVVMMYGVALFASAFMLWFFGRFEGMPTYLIAAQTVVLGFPAALGASAGRLLLQAQ